MKAKTVLKRAKSAVLQAPSAEEGVWQGMPAMAQRDLTPWRTVHVHFATEEAYNHFKKLIGADGLRASGGLNSHSFWYPPIEPMNWTTLVWKSDK